MGNLIHKEDLTPVRSLIHLISVLHDKSFNLYHEVNGGIYTFDRVLCMHHSLHDLNVMITEGQLLYR